MPTLRAIVCGIDFSDHSREAFRWAIALAARDHASLTVVSAVEPVLAHTAQARFGLDLVKQDVEPALRAFVDAALPPGSAWTPPVTAEAHIGKAPDVILETARRHRADLIVIGTHGLGGFRKLLLGSTAERVLRGTNVPTLVLPTIDEPHVVLDAGGPRFEITAIVAATDFSHAATHAVNCAAMLAHEFAARLVLAHVVVPVIVPSEWTPYVQGVDEDCVAQARLLLERTLESRQNGVPTERIVRLGSPAEDIAAVAKERDAGLIVMGLTSDPSALAPKPGSIAYRVLCLAHAPGLVTPFPRT